MQSTCTQRMLPIFPIHKKIKEEDNHGLQYQHCCTVHRTMDFVVNKKNLEEYQVISAPSLELKEGDVLIKILKFAFTANNVSYAATGQSSLGYWNFFPSSQPTKFGKVPVWGIGIIVASRCPDLPEQQKIYGYFPMSNFAVLHPVQVTSSDFIDGASHRKSLPAVYNQYLLCSEDSFYTPITEEAMIVLRPLFFTSWLLVDFFTRHKFFGANSLIISSASSKTSIGLAFCLQKQRRDEQLQIIGLTSHRNLGFVKSLQLYDPIVLYDNFEQNLDSTQPACFVDMAGNTKVTSRLHHHYRDDLKHTCLVGAAHVGQGGKPASKLPGPRPKFFFAPSWTAQRIVELGRTNGKDQSSNLAIKRRGLEILLHNVLLDYQRFVHWCMNIDSRDREKDDGRGWLHMKRYHGPQQVAKGYSACLKGQIGPDTAVVMSLWDATGSTPSISSKL